MKQDTRLSKIIKASLFGAISFLLMRFLEFPIPFLGFDDLKYDMSEVPALIIGFSISPLAGVATVVIKNTLYFLTTMNLIGVAANTVAGITYVGISTKIYSGKKTFRMAVTGMIAGTAAMAAVMVPVNLALVPLFIGKSDPAITKTVLTVMPIFNLFKGCANMLITCILYKKISNAFLKFQNTGIME